MTKLTMILGAVLFVVCGVSIFSFVLLAKINMDIRDMEGLDKAGLIYGYFNKTTGAGDIGKAENIAAELILKYPGSEYTGQAVKKLALEYGNAGKEQKALYYYRMLSKKYPDIAADPAIKSKAEKIKSAVLTGAEFSAEDIIEYTVQPGDNLFAIARKYKTTVDHLQELNGLKNDLIRAGQKLKVNVAVFSIYVDKCENIMILNKNGEPFKTYSIATGKDNSTPVGVFEIVDKMIKPPWTRPDGKIVQPGDPEYELGERWMPISEPGYGIHGTKDETSIGKQATLGCVRMNNADVIELFNLVPRGTKVEIVDTAEKKSISSAGTSPSEKEDKVVSEVIGG